MQFKKTFWLNVFFAIAWVLLCLLSFATDIDYVEHTLTQKIFTAFTQLFILVIPIITSIYLYKSNSLLLRKLALIGNSICVIGVVICLIAIVYNQLSIVSSMDLLIVFFVYSFFVFPFVINLKVLKAS